MVSKEKKRLMLQYAAGITASITSGGYGLSIGWTSPAASYLSSEKSHLPISEAQSDWIASLLSIGFILGYLLNPLIIDRIGRKTTLLLFTIPQISSWILIILANNCTIIYIARVIGGLGYGGGSCATTVYLSEIGNVKNRGILLILVPLSLHIGILYAMLLGAFLPYNHMNIAFSIIPLVFLVIFIFMPDSSYFREKNDQSKAKMMSLIDRQGLRESEENDCKIFNNDSEFNKDPSKINIHKSKINRTEGFYTSTLKFKESRFWKLLSFTSNQRALLIITFLTAQITFSGYAPVLYFTQQIIAYSRFSLNAKKSAVIIASIKIAAALIGTQVVERVRRKILFSFSGILAATGMGFVGMFFFLENQKFDVSSIRWMPLVGLAVYEFMIAFGSINLFYIFLGELFAPDLKSIIVTISKILLTIFTFLSLFQFHEMVNVLGLYVIFFMFAFCLVIGTYIINILLPETKGKSLEEIQFLLKSRKLSFF